MEIKEKIKHYRKEKKWTQKELSEQLNVSDKTISSWETGRTYPDLDSLIELADLFEISLDELIIGDKKMIKTLDEKIKRGNYVLPIATASLIAIALITYISLSPNSYSATIMFFLSNALMVGLIIFVLKILINISKK